MNGSVRSALSWRQTSMPSIFWHHNVQEDKIGMVLPRRHQSFFAIRGFD
jgi:hypothetical protein